MVIWKLHCLVDGYYMLLQAQEKIARHQTGAISAPPAIEPEDGQMLKVGNSNNITFRCISYFSCI